jgi:hypothetical protein
MSEEEIIDRTILLLQCYVELKEDDKQGHTSAYEMQFEDFEAIQGLLDIYQKEKEKNKELEEERKQFYEGELYTAKQLKNIERDRNKYFIHKSKIEELRDIDNIDYLQFKIKELLEERN